MTIIIMQCDCGENLALVVNTEAEKIQAWCPKCGTLYDIGPTEIEADNLADIMESATPTTKAGPEETLFYLRCTDILR